MKKLLAVGLLAVGLLWGVSAFAQLSQTDSVQVFFQIDEYLTFVITEDEVDLGYIQAPDSDSTLSGASCNYLVRTNVNWNLQLTSVSIVTSAATGGADVRDVISTKHGGSAYAATSTAPFYYLTNQAPEDATHEDTLEWKANIPAVNFNNYPAGSTYRIECIITAEKYT